jgi:hypothetical protein
MEHRFNETLPYRSRNGALYQVTRRDTQTADIVMPNGKSCLGTFRFGKVWRDPVPFNSGKSGLWLVRCPTQQMLEEPQQPQ